VIRQAHSYMVGAVSGTALIAAAIVATVLLVSAQAFRDWPLTGLPDLIGGDDSGAVAKGRSTGSIPAGASGAVGAFAAAKGLAGAGTGNASDQQQNASTGSPAGNAPVAATPPGSPATGDPGDGSSPAGSATPSASAPSKSPVPGGGGGNGGGGGQTSDGGSGSGSSTSGQVTKVVNDTVSGVDKATGGVLGETGVTKATEDVVNGVAGPESTVGKTVDKVVDTVGGAVGGLLGGDK